MLRQELRMQARVLLLIILDQRVWRSVNTVLGTVPHLATSCGA